MKYFILLTGNPSSGRWTQAQAKQIHKPKQQESRTVCFCEKKHCHAVIFHSIARSFHVDLAVMQAMNLLRTGNVHGPYPARFICAH